jgi:hypothetical protein
MSSFVSSLKSLVVGVLTREPALVAGVAVAIIGAVAGALGIVVPAATVGQIAAYVVAVLGAALATRTQVSPK